MHNEYAVKGNIIFTKEFGKYEITENGYIVVQDNLVSGVYKKLSKEFSKLSVIDYGNAIIIPGFVDIHLHAAQFANLGLGLDKQLMPWLEEYTFPEEAKFCDVSYAKKVYSALITKLWEFGTTRSCIFATIHKDSTMLLMDMIAKSGLSAFVGKINMDRNSPQYLTEKIEDSICDTEEILKEYSSKYKLVKPIVTPRFVPSCSLELSKKLGILAKKYNAPVQSHLSENDSEVSFVKELHPNCKNYTSVYNEAGLLGDVKTIMAHCVLVDEDEISLLANKSVFVAHCPSSNCNLASGNAPIRRLLMRGIKVGLGSDISAGHSLSMMDIIVNSAQVSNIKWLESNKVDKPLNLAELFYLATKGGGEFFGKVGSFERGYEFDALVIDDSSLNIFKTLSMEERLQKFIYTGDDRNIKERYVAGKKIEKPECYK